MAEPKLNIEITARLDSLDRDFAKVSTMARDTSAKVESAFGNLGGSLKGVAAGLLATFSVDLFAGMVKGAVDAQDHLNDLSKSTSISVEDLAGLGAAARKSGGNLDDIATSVNKLSVAMGKDPEKFKAIGVSARDPIEALKQLSDVFVSIKDPQERAAFAAAALGKSWAGTAPLLAEGGQAIGEMVTQGTKLSKVTAESAKAADELNDRLEDLATASAGARTAFANQLIPALTDIIKQLNAATEASGGFLKGIALWGSVSGDEFDAPGKSIASLSSKIQSLQKDREALSKPTLANKINDVVFGDVADIDRQLSFLTKKLALMKTIQRDQALAGSNYGNEGRSGTSAAPAPNIRKFLDGDSKKKDKKDPYTDLLTPAAQAYAKSIEAIEAAMANADKSTISLNASETILYDLMHSQAWKDMPEPWRDLVVAQSEAGSAAIQLADDYKRLKTLLDATPTAKLDALRDDMVFLRDAFEAGKISAEQFSEAAQAALGNLPDATKEATDAMGEFSRQAAHNMQNAFADFLFDPFQDGTKSMLESFGEMLRRMAANAIAADLSSKIFGKAGGGEGTGLLGVAADWFSKAFSSGGAGDPLASSLGAAGGLPLPSFAVGTDYVPQDMIAQIHKGEKIVPAAYNKDGGGSAGVTVTINNTMSDKAEATVKPKMNNGKLELEVLIAQVLTKDMRNNGSIAQGMQSTFGLVRAT